MLLSKAHVLSYVLRKKYDFVERDIEVVFLDASVEFKEPCLPSRPPSYDLHNPKGRKCDEECDQQRKLLIRRKKSIHCAFPANFWSSKT